MPDDNGSLNDQIDALEILLARSVTFQDAVGVNNERDAKEHIHFDYFDPENGDPDPERPFAVVEELEHGHTLIGEGVGNNYAVGGSLLLMFTANTTAPDDHKQSKREFTRVWGKILDDMAETAGHDGRFGFLDSTMTQRPVRNPKNERGRDNDYFWASQTFQYGEE